VQRNCEKSPLKTEVNSHKLCKTRIKKNLATYYSRTQENKLFDIISKLLRLIETLKTTNLPRQATGDKGGGKKHKRRDARRTCRLTRFLRNLRATAADLWDDIDPSLCALQKHENRGNPKSSLRRFSLSLSPPPAGGGAPPKLHNNSLLVYCRAVAKALGKSKAKTEKGEGKWRLQSKTWGASEQHRLLVFLYTSVHPSVRPST